VKSEFQEIRILMQASHQAIDQKIDHQSALIQQRISQHEKQSDLVQKFITRHDLRFYKVEEEIIKLKAKR
jgi:hypothetical protein